MLFLLSLNVKQLRFKTLMSMAQNVPLHDATVAFSVDIGGMRKKYKGKSDTFTEDDLHLKEPIGQFKVWFDEASNTPEIFEANAMCLSTATKDGYPSGRYVLLKGYGTDGFKFFTNYGSKKGKELEENPRAALTFYWDVLKRMVRIEGCVQKLPAMEADEYFHSRPLASQIGCLVSQQSSVIAGRAVLEQSEKELTAEYGGGDKQVPRPHNWGGYIVIPEKVEFWQGQSDRLHDRICFRRHQVGEKPDGILVHQGTDGWVYERLAP